MKYIPTRNQWKNWKLPSKASYIGVILAIVLFAASTLIVLYLDKYVKESDQPKLAIKTTHRPYLRYKLIGPDAIEFSYELVFTNLGKNTAKNINYQCIKHGFSLSNKTVVEVENSVCGDKTPPDVDNRPPPKLISGDKYFQIFRFSGNDLKSYRIDNLISEYNKGQLSVILYIDMEYDDAITQKRYNTHHIFGIHKDRLVILSEKT